jgi:hypothetical protein
MIRSWAFATVARAESACRITKSRFSTPVLKPRCCIGAESAIMRGDAPTRAERGTANATWAWRVRRHARTTPHPYAFTHKCGRMELLLSRKQAAQKSRFSPLTPLLPCNVQTCLSLAARTPPRRSAGHVAHLQLPAMKQPFRQQTPPAGRSAAGVHPSSRHAAAS